MRTSIWQYIVYIRFMESHLQHDGTDEAERRWEGFMNEAQKLQGVEFDDWSRGDCDNQDLEMRCSTLGFNVRGSVDGSIAKLLTLARKYKFRVLRMDDATV